jgi:hypothetical protein
MMVMVAKKEEKSRTPQCRYGTVVYIVISFFDFFPEPTTTSIIIGIT